MELCNFKVNSLFNVSVFSDNRFNSELPFHGVSPQDTLIDSSKKDIFFGDGAGFKITVTTGAHGYMLSSI